MPNQGLEKNQINRKELLKVLSLLKPGLANKDIIEQGICFNFQNEFISTFNDLLSVCIPFKTGIVGAVRAEEFFRLLDKIPDEMISITTTEKEIQVGSGGKIRAGMALMSTILPSLEPEETFLPIPRQFKEAIKFAMFSVSEDMTRPHLTCVHIQGNKVSSSDNWRITQFIMDAPSPMNFLLPVDAAAALSRYNITHVAVDENWIHFLDEASYLVFSARKKAGNLINVDDLFDITGQVMELPQLTETLERAKVMVEGDCDLDLRVKLTLADNFLICRGQKETGWVEERVPVEYDGPPLTMIANPLFLADILSRTSKVTIGEGACLFWGENFRHIMMLASE